MVELRCGGTFITYILKYIYDFSPYIRAEIIYTAITWCTLEKNAFKIPIGAGASGRCLVELIVENYVIVPLIHLKDTSSVYRNQYKNKI